ncbi:MAG: hypothetical protein ABIJ21_03890 [Nanoarchaeota archaeon]
MKDITSSYQELEERVAFTDPITSTIEWEEQILGYFHKGKLKKPYVIQSGDKYLIFNGNHRVLVAINNQLDLKLRVIENDKDLRIAQEEDERELRYSLQYDTVQKELQKAAETWGWQNPASWKT